MSTLDLDPNNAQYQIRTFQIGKIQINERFFHHSIIITPTQLIEHWRPQTVQELSRADFEPIIALHPDILLLGTGDTHVILSPEIYGHLINLNIGVEVMSTHAACRTYHALSAENRNVAAALLVF